MGKLAHNITQHERAGRTPEWSVPELQPAGGRSLLSKPSLDSLTAAETRVRKLIAEDRTSKEIAELLKISTNSVENHRHTICRKLNIYGLHSLLKFAFDPKSFL